MRLAEQSKLIKPETRFSAVNRGRTTVATGTIRSKFGLISIAATEDAVVLISLPGEDHDDYFHRKLQQLLPDSDRVSSNPVLKLAMTQLREYVAGKRTEFTVPWEVYTSPFRRTVLRKVAQIPYGTVRSYCDVAKLSGSPRAYRAVGSANATNTIPIIVPCHRVVAWNGIGGYGGGIELKRQLLAHEGLTQY